MTEVQPEAPAAAPAVQNQETPDPQTQVLRKKTFDFASRAKKPEVNAEGQEIVRVVEYDLGDGDGVRCFADIDGLTVLQVGGSLAGVDGSAKARALNDAINRIIIEEDQPKFAAKCAEFKLSVDDVVDLLLDMINDLADHPTEASAASSSGPSTNGTGSKESSSSVSDSPTTAVPVGAPSA